MRAPPVQHLTKLGAISSRCTLDAAMTNYQSSESGSDCANGHFRIERAARPVPLELHKFGQTLPTYERRPVRRQRSVFDEKRAMRCLTTCVEAATSRSVRLGSWFAAPGVIAAFSAPCDGACFAQAVVCVPLQANALRSVSALALS
eukprot:6172868-Pleurochrysis_carterae.AAC.1